MAPPSRKPSTSAEIALLPLKNCLVNLPASLVLVLSDVNVAPQNVVVELHYESQPRTGLKPESSVQKYAYVGWTGLPSRGRSSRTVSRTGSTRLGKEQDVSKVEIDTVFASLLGLAEGQRVGVSLHLDPPSVHTVNIEPLTPSDWEIIELHGDFLELNLLSQVRALPNPTYLSSASSQVEHSHPLALHLSPTSTVKVIITSLLPPIPTSSPFAKISSDAEVIVAPKVRSKLTRSHREDDHSTISGSQRSRRNARNGGSSPSLRRRAPQSVIFLRGIDLAMCHEWFDPNDEDITSKNLVLWVHNDVFESQSVGGRTWVVVSILKPGGLRVPLDQHQMQQLKEQESGEPGLPSTRVVAELRCWSYAPDEEQAALSSSLCSTLGFEGMVGCIIKLEAAPNQFQQSKTSRIKLYPFLSDPSPKREGLRFGGDTRSSKQIVAACVQDSYGARNGLLHGPISDGMLLPQILDESNNYYRFAGGIIRLDGPGGENRENCPSWLLGSDHQLVLDVQSEIPKTMTPATLFPTLASSIPRTPLHLIDIDRIITTCISNLALGSSMLVTGGIGSGKTSLVHLLCQRLGKERLFNPTFFSCSKLVTDETRISAVSDTLNRLFMSASWCARLRGHSIVVLDDLDKICPLEAELQVGTDNGRSRLITEILCSIARYYCVPGSGVVLLATAASKDSLNHIVISGHIFGEILDLKAPDKGARRNILANLVKPADGLEAKTDNHIDHPHIVSQHRNRNPWMGSSDTDSEGALASAAESISLSPNVDLLDLAGRTDGFMPRDLEVLVSRARNECLIRTITSTAENYTPHLTLTQKDFVTAQKNFTPSSLRAVPLTRSSTTFASVGGLHETRKTLLETLLYPTKYAPIFSACPLRLRSGLLLYGYPGCGKTLLASAVAGECGLNFISVKGPEILNKYIGASEKSVRDLFERAQAAKPCVLFFDEFDSVAPKRGHDSTGVTDRVVNQLLTQMDGAEGLEGVYVLAATSRPDLIDPALLRPGRLDKSLLCDMPDLVERLDILTAVSKEKLVLDSRVKEGLKEVAARTEGFSGADLQALMYNVHLEAVHELIGDDTFKNKVPSNGRASKSNTNGHAVNGTTVKPSPRNPQRSENDFLQFLYDPEADAAARSRDPTASSTSFEPSAIVAEKLAMIKSARRTDKQQHRQPLQSSSSSSSKPLLGHGGANGPLGSSDGMRKGMGKGMEKDADQQRRKREEEEEEEEEETDRNVVTISWHHVEQALASTRCSISRHERDRLRAIYREFVVGRNGEMPSGEGGREVGGRTSLM